MNNIKAVLLDYDGVIADSINAISEIKKLYANSLGIFPESVGITGKGTMLELRELGITGEGIRNFLPFLEKEITKRVEEVPIFAGIDHVVAELNKNFKVGIVSNNYTSFIAPHLQRHEMRHFVHAIFDGNEKNIKPHPGQIISCLAALDVKPQEACFVGDTLMDIQAARAAKLKKMIAVSYGYTKAEHLKDADIIINRPEEIIKAIKDNMV